MELSYSSNAPPASIAAPALHTMLQIVRANRGSGRSLARCLSLWSRVKNAVTGAAMEGPSTSYSGPTEGAAAPRKRIAAQRASSAQHIWHLPAAP